MNLEQDVIFQHKTEVLHHNKDILFHTHDGFELYLFLGGDADFFMESYSHHLERGDLILTNPFDFHNVVASESKDYERLFINVKEEVLHKLGDSSTNLADCFEDYSNGINLLHLTEDEIQKLIFLGDELKENLEKKEYGSQLMVNAILTQIMVFINKKKRESDFRENVKPIDLPPLVQNALQFINENLQNEITVLKVAEALQLNQDYLSRSFKKFTGTSLGHYILLKKVNLAQKYLHQGYNATEACYKSGFNNYSNFSRSFSNIVGQSPGEYKRS